jgi:hypothetical protein
MAHTFGVLSIPVVFLIEENERNRKKCMHREVFHKCPNAGIPNNSLHKKPVDRIGFRHVSIHVSDTRKR